MFFTARPSCLARSSCSWTARGQPRYGTLPLDAEESKQFARIPETLEQGGFSESSVIQLGGRDFLERSGFRSRNGAIPWRPIRWLFCIGKIVGGPPPARRPIRRCWLAWSRWSWRWWLRRGWRTGLSCPSSNCGGRFRRWPTAIFAPCRSSDATTKSAIWQASVNQMAEQLGRYEVEVATQRATPHPGPNWGLAWRINCATRRPARRWPSTCTRRSVPPGPDPSRSMSPDGNSS